MPDVIAAWQSSYKDDDDTGNEPTSLFTLCENPTTGTRHFYCIDFHNDVPQLILRERMRSFLPRNLIYGQILQACENPVDGIHSPQLDITRAAPQSQQTITQNIHNECQRLGFYHFLVDTTEK